MKILHLFIFLILIPFVVLVACKSLNQNGTYYTLILDDDNIWVEQFDNTNLDDSRYNHNNTIFKEHTSFIYSFKHLTKDNQRLSFKYIDSLSDWKFQPYSSKKDGLFEKVSITVLEGVETMQRYMPDYNQTVISYSYQTYNDFAPFGSTSGVIENEKNVWMHPPRDKYFKILELNPFPYIKAPYKVGNSWNWSLSISDFIMVVVTATLASIGTAGVPSVGLFMLAMVLQQVGLPVEGIGYIIGIDRILDMIRTAVNVTGDASIACVIARSENGFTTSSPLHE